MGRTRDSIRGTRENECAVDVSAQGHAILSRGDFRLGDDRPIRSVIDADGSAGLREGADQGISPEVIQSRGNLCSQRG